MTNESIKRINRIRAEKLLAEKDLAVKMAGMQYFAQQCRINTFDMIHRRGNGHWGGSSSVTELLTVLYFHMLNIRPGEPDWENRDRLILSKGHGAPALYQILAERGYFAPADLEDFRELDSHLQGHPSMIKTPGVEMSTGALGHGISIGLGMALAAGVLQKNYWTFIIVGDGCLNEGQSWEGIMAAAKFKPARLVIMVDYNRVQLDGPAPVIMPLDPLTDKLRAFNLPLAEKIYDGHSVEEILESWQWMQENEETPVAVIYKTHKGKGISFTEDEAKWHGAPIDMDSWKKGRRELLENLENLENLEKLKI